MPEAASVPEKGIWAVPPKGCSPESSQLYDDRKVFHAVDMGSRAEFLWPVETTSSLESGNALLKCFACFGSRPRYIQVDNGEQRTMHTSATLSCIRSIRLGIFLSMF